jgi:hypothetical protein
MIMLPQAPQLWDWFKSTLPPAYDSIRGQWVGTIQLSHGASDKTVRHAVLQMNVRAIDCGFHTATRGGGRWAIWVSGCEYYRGAGEITVEGESAPRPVFASISHTGRYWDLRFTSIQEPSPFAHDISEQNIDDPFLGHWSFYSDEVMSDFYGAMLKFSPGRLQFDNKKAADTARVRFNHWEWVSGDLHKGSIEEYRQLQQVLLSAKK